MRNVIIITIAFVADLPKLLYLSIKLVIINKLAWRRGAMKVLNWYYKDEFSLDRIEHMLFSAGVFDPVRNSALFDGCRHTYYMLRKQEDKHND